MECLSWLFRTHYNWARHIAATETQHIQSQTRTSHRLSSQLQMVLGVCASVHCHKSMSLAGAIRTSHAASIDDRIIPDVDAEDDEDTALFSRGIALQ